ncbi:cation diffusion facilitator family transporter [Microbacterium oxydans]|uniref:Cobalt-zinc-cadmium resistance protein CzcD n=1 Tax=Microbacterium oxydans TaxID=82380 RepID=A0A0F0L9Z9_9MICO|nr:cation diffusion facilitator family transporter [Microbacterium oxydans]KJL29100.1 Cobalt-zinc-cadmium resistance protein CzcD [Microbacterium oxydans]
MTSSHRHEHGDQGHSHQDHDHGHPFSDGHPTRPVTVEAGGHGHSHDHGLEGHSTAGGKHRKKLVLVLCITFTVFAVQVVGALISGSLALLADAGHMLTDATGVLIALIATFVAALPATSKRTYGLMRVEVLSAMINGIVLSVICVVIVWTAIQRLGTEVEIETGPMLIAAIAGAIANLISLLILQSGQKESINVRGAYLEVLGDLLGSGAVIVAGFVILFTGWNWVDQVAAFAIAALIAPRAYSLLKDVVRILLESTPKDVDLDKTREHMMSVPGVERVHDLHAWTITSGVNAMSAHVVIDQDALDWDHYDRILDELHACLGEHFDTNHCTIQLEPVHHSDHENDVHA